MDGRQAEFAAGATPPLQLALATHSYHPDWRAVATAVFARAADSLLH
jgi:hypothetical protein